MLGVFAEFERELIPERTRQGIHQRIKVGYIHGRPKALGYFIPGTGAVWQVDEREAAVVRWIYDKYFRGVGSMQITVILQQDIAATLTEPESEEETQHRLRQFRLEFDSFGPFSVPRRPRNPRAARVSCGRPFLCAQQCSATFIREKLE